MHYYLQVKLEVVMVGEGTAEEVMAEVVMVEEGTVEDMVDTDMDQFRWILSQF